MAGETLVRLKIISSRYSPEAITEVLGLQCDRYWRIGEKRVHTIMDEKNHGWVLNSGLSKSDSLDEHVKHLLERVRGRTENSLAVGAGYR